MRVLVCGGRNFNDTELLDRTLDEIHAETPISVVIHGTYRGADTMADAWAKRNGVDVDPYAPDWNTHGRAAGPIRNGVMLRYGKPDRVVAFKGHDGTKDMVRQARRAKVPVTLIGWSYDEAGGA